MSTRTTRLAKIVDAAKRRGRDDTNFQENETEVEHNIVVPILEELGWPKLIDADSHRIKTRYNISGWRKNDGGVVDIALCASNEPKVFVEVKKCGQGGFSEKEKKQLQEYCVHEAVQIGVLTNGFDWHIYLRAKSLKMDAIDNALAKRIAIDQGEFSLVSEMFERLLGRDTVCNGDAEKTLRKERRLSSKTLQKEQNLQRMNEAWRQLFGSESESLQKALMAPLKKILKRQLNISDKKALPWPIKKDRQIETFVKDKCEEIKDIAGLMAAVHPHERQGEIESESATFPKSRVLSTTSRPTYFYVFGTKMKFHTWGASVRRFLDEASKRDPNAPRKLADGLPKKFIRSSAVPNSRHGKPLGRWQRAHRIGNSDVWVILAQNRSYMQRICRDVQKVLRLPEDTIKFE